MKIIVLGRASAESFKSNLKWAAISISDSGNWVRFNTENLDLVLQLAFKDQEGPSLAYPDQQLFEKQHAVKILDFVEKVKDDIDILLVHCEKGESRSPAVAAVLDLCYNKKEPNKWFNKPYRPNRLVYRILYETAHERNLCEKLNEIPNYE